MGEGWRAVTLDGAVWAGWSVAVSWRGAHWSSADLGADSWTTRLRGWELRGHLYERLGVRRWRRLVPDAGRLFGGRPRRLVHSRDPREWEALAAETRRAERVHWRIIAALPVILLWNRGILLPAMVGYAAVANGPCLAIQRYNRSRVTGLQDRRRRREESREPLG